MLSRRRVLLNPFECCNDHTSPWLRSSGGGERENARYFRQYFVLGALDLLVEFPIRLSHTAVFFVEIQPLKDVAAVLKNLVRNGFRACRPNTFAFSQDGLVQGRHGSPRCFRQDGPYFRP